VELGGVGMSRLHALDASLGLILAATPAALQARTLALTGRLREGLEERSAVLLTPRQDHRRAGILSALRPDSEAWHLWALSAGVVQSQRGPGTIRFALHGYNNEDDVDALLEAWDHRP
jgi:selenocysteine lyase/cysteine desulfurase